MVFDIFMRNYTTAAKRGQSYIIFVILNLYECLVSIDLDTETSSPTNKSATRLFIINTSFFNLMGCQNEK